jgi:hypothetical protein
MATSNGTALTTAQAPKPPVRTGAHGVQLTTLEEMWRFSEAVARSGIAPRGLQKPEQILIAIEYGAELGLRPMAAMAVVMVVNGRPTLYGDGMLAVVQSSGLLVDIKETLAGDGDTLAATCIVARSGRPTPSTCTFTWNDAKRAGLTGSDTYKKFPGRMLKARARAFALRDAFPDVLCGVISTDEANDLADDAAPVFAEGAAQPPSDLDGLMQTDAIEVDPQIFDGTDGTQERDDGGPSDEELRRDGLLI